MTSTEQPGPADVPGNSELLQGIRVAFIGRLASMGRREAAQLLRSYGAVVVERPDPSVQWIVVGEQERRRLKAKTSTNSTTSRFARPERGVLKSSPKRNSGSGSASSTASRDPPVYTPAMLRVVGRAGRRDRRWQRRGLIVPVREVRRLAYFDFQEVATARRLAELLAAGISPAAIEKKLEKLARYLPGVQRPLTQLSVIVEGKQILLRQGDGLLEPGGQLRFDFEAAENQAPTNEAALGDADPLLAVLGRPGVDEKNVAPDEMCQMAAELEEAGQVEAAAEMYRAAMAAGGPTPEICFQVAELLYRIGDLCGARERYYMAIELDEDYVEARSNLGCVLAETGQLELAVAAFQALATTPIMPTPITTSPAS